MLINKLPFFFLQRKHGFYKAYIRHFVPLWIYPLCFFHKQLFFLFQFQPFLWRNIRICIFFIFQIFLCK